MKKLLTLVGVLSLLLVLVGCTSGGDQSITPPSFVGVSVDNTNPYNGTDYTMYYKEKNESTKIGVEISNPSNLEIRAIVINGYSYRYSTFTEDSTNSEIYFFMDAGETLGLTEYTVDDIEYFDGADTKDVLVDENNEFHLYVYKDLPTVFRDSYQLTQDSISVDFNVTDVDGVIEDGSLVIKIYEGSTELVPLRQNMIVGFNSVSFANSIKADTNYEIQVYADYDLDDTNGLREEVILFSGSFTTLPTAVPSAQINNLVISSNSVTFDVVYNDTDNVTLPAGARVEVYDGTTFITSVGINGSVTGVTFEDLLNSKEYNLKIITDYDLRNGDGTKSNYVLTQQVFTTSARSVPEPRIDNVVVEENRILFDFVLEDDLLDPIIDMSTMIAKVYVDGVYTKTVGISSERVEIQINDVLSGKDVRVDFIATYDLNDGNGAISGQVIGVFDRTSLLNASPRVIVNDVVVTQGYISMDLVVLDNSSTLLGSVRALLYKVTDDGFGNEIEEYIDTQFLTTESISAIFSHLVEANSNYRIKVLADYNLKDGLGNKENQVLYTHEITSMQPKAPASEIQNSVIYNNGFEFDVIVMDADGTVVPNSLFIYIYRQDVSEDANGKITITMVLLDTLTESLVVGTNHITYTNLNSDYTYQVVVKGDYDVLDGSDLQTEQVLVTKTLKTAAKVLPEATISDVRKTTESIIFDANVKDLNSVIEPNTLFAVLYYNDVATGDVLPLVVGNNYDLEFTGIQSDTGYTVELVTDYDLDNGEGIVSDYPLGDFNQTTDPKYAPDAEIQDIEVTTDTIVFDVILTDPFEVTTAAPKALLYVGNVFTGKSVDLNVGLNLNVEFTDVYSNANFIIYIVSSYDLNDGINVFTDKELTYDFAETETNELVSGDLYDVTVGIDTITFSAVITDNSNVVTNNLRAYLILDGTPTGDYVDLVVGDNMDEQFTGLISDSEYTIELRTDYDLRDIDGERTDYFLDSYTTSTDAYTAPDGYVTNVSQTIDSIRFDTVVIDISDTSTGNYKAVLYYQGMPEGQEAILNEGLTQLIEFSGLFSGVDYEIKIEAIYDLYDGVGEQTAYVYSSSVQTISRKAPVGNASGIVIEETSVKFQFNYVDEDSTLIPNTFRVWLYDEDNNLIDQKDLYNDEVFFDVSYLIADYPFTIRVTGDYDLSNGELPVQDGVLLSLDLRTYANMIPSVILSNVVINQNDVQFDFSVSDADEVLQGNFKAQLFDNEHNLVQEIAITDINGTITFNGVILNVREWYNIIVVADYNLRDGNLVQTGKVLGERAIQTFNSVIPQSHIYDVVTTTSSIQFDAYIYDNYATYSGNAKAILYRDGVQVQEIALVIGHNDDVIFSGLVSNTEYTIEIQLDYDNSNTNGVIVDYVMATESYSVDAKEVPSAVISVPVISSEQAAYDITIVDNDSVITGNLVAVVYKDGVATGIFEALINGVNNNVTFTGLNSNTDYEIRVFADYDLDDEVTVLTTELIGSVEFTTTSNTVPTAQFSNITSDNGSVTFDVSVLDPDTVITGNIIVRLYRNNVYTGITQSVSVGANLGVSFTNLYSSSNYTVELAVDYNLNDGLGAKSAIVLANASTVTYSNSNPEAEIGEITSTVDSVTFSANVFDDDSTITGNLQAVLYLNGFATGDTISLSVGANINKTFTGLLSNKNYEVAIEADYNLRDGSPAEVAYELAGEFSITKSKATPNAVVTDYSVTNTTISIDVDVVDGSSAIVGQAKAVLYADGVATGQEVLLSVGSNVGVLFTGLDYGFEYTVQIETDYNNNVGNPDITDYVITSEAIATQALVAIENVITEAFDVSFDVVLDDEFGILDDEYLTLKLYDDTDTLRGTYELLGSGSIDVLNYYNDHGYRVEILANVTAEGTAVVVYEQSLAVPARLLQNVAITAIGVNGTSISTNIAIVLPDPEQVIDSATVEAVLYELIGGVFTQIDQITLIDGDNAVIFNGVDGTDGTVYMIQVEATVNFNDGLGDQTDYVIDARTFIWTDQN